jgi:hypothetical protein
MGMKSNNFWEIITSSPVSEECTATVFRVEKERNQQEAGGMESRSFCH